MTALTAAIGIIDTDQGRTYKAWLIPEDGLTDGDDRLFVGPIQWRADRIPLTFSDVEGEPHEEARHVGNLDNLRREMRDGESWLVADVDWDDDELALEAKRLVDEDRLRGISVHPTEGEGWMICNVPDNPTADLVEAMAAEFDPETCDRPILAFTNVIVGAATLLMLPAFEDAEVVVAAVGSVHDYPMAPRSRRWDAAAADRRWRTFTDSTDGPSSSYRNGFLYWTGAGENFGDYKLQVADVVDGRAHYVPRAVFAAAGGRGVDAADIPDGDKTRIKAAICRLYGKIEDAPPCPFSDDEASVGEIVAELIESVPVASDGLEAANPFDRFIDPTFTITQPVIDFISPTEAAHTIAWKMTNNKVTGSKGYGIQIGPVQAAADLHRPPLEWFTDPQLSEPTPLCIDDDGRVYGHLALWDTCHRGFADTCITPPPDSTDYGEFHDNARLMTAEGQLLPVGCLTFDVSHADVRASADVAKRHYDHSGTVGAFVRAGQDDIGVWVAGAIRPGLTDDQIEMLRRLSLSGDWRPRGGSYFLIAAQAVPVPGFPIRARVASGLQVSLTTLGPAQREAIAASLETVGTEALIAAALGRLDAKLDVILEVVRKQELQEAYQAAMSVLVPADPEV